MKNVHFLVTNIYAAPVISYYDSENTLAGLKEYTHTLCIAENDQMAYKLIVESCVIIPLFYA